MRRSAKTAVFVTAASSLSATLARAEHARVELHYVRQAAPRSCPDEATFRSLVAARLGYDACVASAPRTLSVRFEARGGEVVGQMELGPDGEHKAVKRSLRAAKDECFELASSLALVVAVAVDPSTLAGNSDASQATPSQLPAPTSPSAATSAPTAPAAALPAVVGSSASPAVSAPVSERAGAAAEFGHGGSEPASTTLELQLGGLLGGGVVPSLSAGARAGVAVGFSAWSMGLEASFFSAGTRVNSDGPGEVSAFAVAGSLVPCAHPWETPYFRPELCAVGSLGVLRATAHDVGRAAPTTSLVASLAPRLGVLARISRSFGVRLSAEVPFALSRQTLLIEDVSGPSRVWVQPLAGYVLGAALVASIR